MHALDATPWHTLCSSSRIGVTGDRCRMAGITAGSMIGARTSNCIPNIWLNGSSR